MSSKIIMYQGRRGCGKTLTMVKDGFNYWNDGWRVLRNFGAKYGEYISEEEILSLNKNSELFNCVIMIDEIQIFLDSRESMKKHHISFSNFIQQIRKRNIILLVTTQYENTLDRRLKQHVDIKALPNFIIKYNVCEVLYIDSTFTEDSLLNNNSIQIKPKSFKIVFDAIPIFKLYETEEMIR